MAKLSSCKWQVAPSSGQICNQFKWCQVMVKFRTDPSVPFGELWTNTSGAAYNWRNLEPMQVAFYLAGEILSQVESIPWVRCASGNVWMYGSNSWISSAKSGSSSTTDNCHFWTSGDIFSSSPDVLYLHRKVNITKYLWGAGLHVSLLLWPQVEMNCH